MALKLTIDAILHVRIGPEQLLGEAVGDVQPRVAEVAFLVGVRLVCTRPQQIEEILLSSVAMIPGLTEVVATLPCIKGKLRCGAHVC